MREAPLPPHQSQGWLIHLSALSCKNGSALSEKEDEKVEEAQAEEAEKEVRQRKKEQQHRDHSLGSCDLALNDKWQLGSRVGNSTLLLFTLNIGHSCATAVTDHSRVSSINTIIWELWYGSDFIAVL